MEAVLGIFFLGFALFTLIVYLKSHEHILKRLVKGASFAFLSVLASGAAITGDFGYSIAIGLFVAYMTYRRLINNKNASVTQDHSQQPSDPLVDSIDSDNVSISRAELQRLQAIEKKLTVNRNELKRLKDLERNLRHQQPQPAVFIETDTATSKARQQKTTNRKKNSTPFSMVAFSYKDSQGDTTYREVDVKKVGDEYITGYCHLRQQIRTFRTDRIISNEIILRESGEIMDIDDWLELI
ncbi:WYL domain-containing protein [Plesiomonas shigelloides]|uniref:WYL domain-containing protein n=1 Tax=Plesiomonas shigelloides TaxID=703 RepID=UPI0012620476|nr:WYL domain-containing protein [Plesiomonas shigelloides]KAB7668131.1 hypothetical protein GBN18_08040 [Plesiomonas shigelloides]